MMLLILAHDYSTSSTGEPRTMSSSESTQETSFQAVATSRALHTYSKARAVAIAVVHAVGCMVSPYRPGARHCPPLARRATTSETPLAQCRRSRKEGWCVRQHAVRTTGCERGWIRSEKSGSRGRLITISAPRSAGVLWLSRDY